MTETNHCPKCFRPISKGSAFCFAHRYSGKKATPKKAVPRRFSCAWCEKSFLSPRKNSVFCSPECYKGALGHGYYVALRGR